MDSNQVQAMKQSLKQFQIIDADKFIDMLQEMSDDQLAAEIIKHPKLDTFILPFVNDLQTFYNAVQRSYIPYNEIASAEDARLNSEIPKLLNEIGSIIYSNLSPEQRRAREEYTNLIIRLEQEISYGSNPEFLVEYCEKHGYHLDEIYDAVSLSAKYNSYKISDYNEVTIAKIFENARNAKLESARSMSPQRTSLQQRESELSALEAEEKIIAETESLIDKQQEGQDLGE